jgi:signal transduction histidine kinase
MADNCTIVGERDTQAGSETDRVEELRASRRRLLRAADAERRAIERELHDGLQQLLVRLAADVELASALVETDPAAASRQLAEVKRVVGEALAEARALAHRIHPALEAGGLGPALRLAAANAEGSTLRDRVEALDGTIDVRSDPGPRTVWAGFLPLPR